MTRFITAHDDQDWTHRLQHGKAKHIPIQAFEVAEFHRPLSWMLWEVVKLPLLILGLSAVVVVMGHAAQSVRQHSCPAEACSPLEGK